MSRRRSTSIRGSPIRPIPKRHYVEHYAVDFGMSLGAMAATDHDWWRSNAYRVDFAQMFRRAVHARLREPAVARPRRARPARRGLDVRRRVRRRRWHTDWATYAPFRTADRFDKYWGAKIVARFTRARIHAAAEAGRFSDPRAVEVLTDMCSRGSASRSRTRSRAWRRSITSRSRHRRPRAAVLRRPRDRVRRVACAPDALRDLGVRLRCPSRRLAHRPRAKASGHACAPLKLAHDARQLTIVRIVTSAPTSPARRSCTSCATPSQVPASSGCGGRDVPPREAGRRGRELFKLDAQHDRRRVDE